MECNGHCKQYYFPQSLLFSIDFLSIRNNVSSRSLLKQTLTGVSSRMHSGAYVRIILYLSNVRHSRKKRKIRIRNTVKLLCSQASFGQHN